MKIKPCGHFREKPPSPTAREPINTYVPKTKWTITEVGTDTHYDASNSNFEVEVVEGCFGKMTKVKNVKTGAKNVLHHLHRDGSVLDWQERLERTYLFPDELKA